MDESNQSDYASELSADEKKEVESAAKRAEKVSDPAEDARTWLLNTHRATLCTTAAKPSIEGFPFGSIVPFAIDRCGKPYIMIADIAAHTANLRRDPRAALMVSNPEAIGDPQASWRITLIGSMKRICASESAYAKYPQSIQVTAEEHDELHRRYVERVPEADQYIRQHSFFYWRMEDVSIVRYIAGFGRICWIDGHKILREPLGGGLESSAQGAIDHMNEDHSANMIEMCEGLYGFKPETAEMFDLDATGFHISTKGPERSLFFSFNQEIDSSTLRLAVIDVLKRARTRLNT